MARRKPPVSICDTAYILHLIHFSFNKVNTRNIFTEHHRKGKQEKEKIIERTENVHQTTSLDDQEYYGICDYKELASIE